MIKRMKKYTILKATSLCISISSQLAVILFDEEAASLVVFEASAVSDAVDDVVALVVV